MFTRKCKGFTLAEVLITLAVAGVVAAMTLPVLINNYEKKVTTAKLKKFYSVMQQAIKLAEAENGEFTTWAPTSSSITFEKWYNTYLDKHIVSIDKENLTSRNYQVGFKDGSGFVAYTFSGGANVFYCTLLKHCGVEKFDGRVSFVFMLSKSSKGYFHGYGYGKSREVLLEGCKYGNFDDPDVSSSGRRHYCSGLLELDGWEFKDDYPWKQTMLEN